MHAYYCLNTNSDVFYPTHDSKMLHPLRTKAKKATVLHLVLAASNAGTHGITSPNAIPSSTCPKEVVSCQNNKVVSNPKKAVVLTNKSRKELK